ncbi:protein CYSTEINE-RICH TRANSMEMBRANE MODULE 9-like [Gastrolobium bilobum]|uniref:protein CYSTEINE-RICH TRANSMEMBRANE MODULE 9-like n=1 Tax=Gastrolobium bilobum TaxID=150636 RepID=UPI002AB0ACC1|nr:protein CYSTEINE-RICH TRANSMEMBRANE MODULE 9-like [Gastrolobium bilobum]
MSHFNNHQEAPVSYPPTGQVYPPPTSYVSAPPPMGYPSKDGPVGYPQQSVTEQTTSRGDGFWKGCCAALCCCWVLDCCF